jgi:hypothetical protein
MVRMEWVLIVGKRLEVSILSGLPAGALWGGDLDGGIWTAGKWWWMLWVVAWLGSLQKQL